MRRGRRTGRVARERRPNTERTSRERPRDGLQAPPTRVPIGPSGRSHAPSPALRAPPTNRRAIDTRGSLAGVWDGRLCPRSGNWKLKGFWKTLMCWIWKYVWGSGWEWGCSFQMPCGGGGVFWSCGCGWVCVIDIARVSSRFGLSALFAEWFGFRI